MAVKLFYLSPNGLPSYGGNFFYQNNHYLQAAVPVYLYVGRSDVAGFSTARSGYIHVIQFQLTPEIKTIKKIRLHTSVCYNAFIINGDATSPYVRVPDFYQNTDFLHFSTIGFTSEILTGMWGRYDDALALYALNISKFTDTMAGVVHHLPPNNQLNIKDDVSINIPSRTTYLTIMQAVISYGTLSSTVSDNFLTNYYKSMSADVTLSGLGRIDLSTNVSCYMQ